MDQAEILERAKALGKLLADNARVKAYLDAQQHLQRDDAARKLLRDYQLLAEKLQGQQTQGQRVVQTDADQLGSLEKELAGNETVKNWLRGQSDYVDLMYRVDRSIQEGLAAALGKPTGAQQPSQRPSEPFTPRIVPPPEA